jgi:hypothetical protein
LGPEELKQLIEQVQEQIKQGICRPSTSAWGSPSLMVRKKDVNGVQQPLRWCGDYRRLNNVTLDDAYPVPDMAHCIDTAASKKWRSKLDLLSGYWHLPVAEEDIQKTAIATVVGLVEFTRTPFGLKTAPKTFQRAMNHIYAERLHKDVLAYLDDLLAFTDTFEQHLEVLSWMFKVFY